MRRMINYYEVLEISENASQEVIDKVYKLFAKKYHPDLNPDNPKEAEEKFKRITEAYEVLSDESKRKSYDEKLKTQRMIENTQNTQNQTINVQQPQIDYSRLNEEEIAKIQEEYKRKQEEDIKRQKLEEEYKIKKAYNDAYIAALEKMGVKVVYKKSWREQLDILRTLIMTFILFIITCIVLWNVPYTHNKIIEIYNESGPLKNLIDIIISSHK